MQEVERLREEEVRVDENHLDLVQQAGLGDGVKDDAVAGDERCREDGVLLLLRFKSSSSSSSSGYSSKPLVETSITTGGMVLDGEWLGTPLCSMNATSHYIKQGILARYTDAGEPQICLV